MIRAQLAVLALAISAASSAAQPAVLRVTLEVTAPALPDSFAIYATGSHPALGNWNPAGFKLTSQGNHTWRGTFTLDRATSIEYKFTLGIWEREAADSTGAPFRNLNARVTSDTLLRTQVGNWTSGPRPRVLNGQITGTLKYHRNVSGEGLAARDLEVWLPPGYDANATGRYPVLYMFDGQNVFDPATSTLGIDWAVDEAADSLIKSRTVPAMIIVGMNSSAQRTQEYLPGPLTARHMAYVIGTVKPLIDATYRTRPEAASTWVGGASAGGIAAFMLVWERPDLFSRALAFSPAFQSPAGLGLNFDYLPNVRGTAQPPRGVRFYIDMGGVGLDEQLRPGTDSMLTLLRARGYRDEVDLRFVADPTAEHNELAWRRRFPAALAWLLR
jgi:enterochelin esterase-like enzyme